MAKTKIVYKLQGFREIRTAPKVMSVLDDEAARIARACGDGFEAKPAKATGGRVRGRSAVVTTTGGAARRQSRDHVLEKAVGGGGV
ncbi:MAG: hypothetical protein LBL55_09325 [Propionibacteriaceae bacterium]|jgi:hypothetical protein|nr:hypothetical protein [Propionibacteriaceae bacterium]